MALSLSSGALAFRRPPAVGAPHNRCSRGVLCWDKNNGDRNDNAYLLRSSKHFIDTRKVVNRSFTGKKLTHVL